jgi:hypothetical protein
VGTRVAGLPREIKEIPAVVDAAKGQGPPAKEEKLARLLEIAAKAVAAGSWAKYQGLNLKTLIEVSARETVAKEISSIKY